MVRHLSVALLLLVVAACSGGDGSSESAGDTTSPAGTAPPLLPPDEPLPPAPPGSLRVYGSVVKGPVDGASVSLYALDAAGNRASDTPVARTTTDAYGRWSVIIPEGSAALLAEATGGSYIDESDSSPLMADKRVIPLGPAAILEAVLLPGETEVAVTVYSNALLMKSRHEAGAGNFLEVFGNNRAVAAQAAGFDVLTTVPANPVSPDPASTLAARQYALALGGVANVLNNIAVAFDRPAPDYPMIAALIRDLSDCRLDGADAAGPVGVDVGGVMQMLPDDIDLNIEIERFRNNNIEQYRSTVLMYLDEDMCSRPGDVSAPVFTSVPAPFSVAAVDASGTPAANPVIQSELASVTAADDGPGAVSISDDAPSLFPLGDTLVTFTAVDAAGNSATASVLITVEDQTPPSISAPGDVTAASTGSLTLPDLGQPVVADNVSQPSELLVFSDAPQAGFPVGIHSVLWTVVDEAGLTATDVQSVTIIASTPVNSPPSFSVSGDVDVQEDFSGLRSVTVMPDPVPPAEAGQTVSYSLSPAAATVSLASIGFDPATGEVSITSAPDANGNQLFMITADDGQPVNNTFTQSFLLNVSAVNDPPAFSLSGDVELPMDFTGIATVTVTPAPVPADEQGQNVTYAISPTVSFAQVAIDEKTGKVGISSVPGGTGSQLMVVSADDGQDSNNLHQESFLLTVEERDEDGEDRDGDGLPDDAEVDAGTDPDNPDTDGDGVGDGPEVDAGGDPLTPTPSSRVFYVSRDGDDANSGRSWAEAKATNAGLQGVLLEGLDAATPTYVLYQGGALSRSNDWALDLDDNCDHIVLLGSMEPGRYIPVLGTGDSPTTRFAVASGTVIEAYRCQNLQLHDIELTGGDRAGARLTKSEVRADNLRVLANSSPWPGGGIKLRWGSLALQDSVIAANGSAAEGGGLYVRGAELDLRHSLISGNCAVDSGGGISFDHPASQVEVANLLLAANAAEEGGAVAIAGDSGVLRNLTAAYNEARQPQGGAGVALGGSSTAEIRDSIFGNNRDGNGAANTFTTSVTPAVSDFNLVEQPPLGSSDIDISLSGAGFAQGYYLDQIVSPAVDSGSQSAATAGLDERYTDPGPVPRPDSGILDRGYHYRQPATARADSYVRFAGTQDPVSLCAENIDATAMFVVPLRGGVPIGPGYRVVATLQPGTAGHLRNAVKIDPLQDGRSVILTDMGDGRYLYYVTPSAVAPDTEIELYVDDQPVDEELPLT